MSYFILGALMLVIFASGYAYWRICKARAEIDRLFKVNQQLRTENHQQAVEIERKKAEVKYANVAKNHQENARRSSRQSVDEQLQQQGWFRGDSPEQLHGIRADLSCSSGHAGDETSSACTQSDL